MYWSLDAGFVGDWIWRAVSIDARESAKWESNYRVVIVRAAFTDSTACCHARHLISRLFPPRPGTGPEDGNLIGKKKVPCLMGQRAEISEKGLFKSPLFHSIRFHRLQRWAGSAAISFLLFSFFSRNKKKRKTKRKTTTKGHLYYAVYATYVVTLCLPVPVLQLRRK